MADEHADDPVDKPKDVNELANKEGLAAVRADLDAAEEEWPPTGDPEAGGGGTGDDNGAGDDGRREWPPVPPGGIGVVDGVVALVAAAVWESPQKPMAG